MRRLLAVFCLLALTPSLAAQSPAGPGAKSRPVAKAAGPAANTAAIPGVIKDLPVRKVVLYKNGVGYFEHAGAVSGNQRVAIDFTSSQLNDVLQSLTALDSKDGKIGTVSYSSTSPIEQQLKTLALGLKDYPATVAVYQAIRGQRVEVTGAGAPLTGRLVNVEFRKETDKNGQTSEDHYFLIVATDSGALRTAELTDSVSVRMLDPSLEKQFANYLEIVASAQNQQLRRLTLEDRGAGERQLLVSYISEVPVWKSTYRIVFPQTGTSNVGGSAIVQGWAVVDNTVGTDWDSVQLSLVAGAPQSFIQPLSQPLYTRRPEIPIATEEQITPQTHEAAELQTMNGGLLAPQAMAMGKAQAIMAGPASGFGVAGMEGVGSGSGGGIGSGSGNGYGPGTGGGAGGGLYHVAGGVVRPTDAIQEGDVFTNAFDDFFEYALATPVTVHKNESAMVPILQQELPAEHVTLWSDKEQTPLRAVWLENKSKLTLDAGSFSIFESGEFAGEGLLDPIHPGEKRLLSYAADQAVKVHRGGYMDTRTLHHIAMHEGVLVEQTSEVSESTYTVTNAADEARTVIVEHARHGNAELDSEPKPAETTATAYRFREAVDPHQSEDLHVGEKAMLNEKIRITPDNTDWSEFLVTTSKYTPELEEKLRPLIDAETALNDLTRRIGENLEKQKTLAADEGRDRDNLTALKGNDAAKRFVEELNRAEDEIEAARKEQAGLEKDRDAARAHLEIVIAALSFDTDLSVVTQSSEYGDRAPRR
jgi:hypothetical protein